MNEDGWDRSQKTLHTETSVATSNYSYATHAVATNLAVERVI
jgi:hypothetical protein